MSKETKKHVIPSHTPDDSETGAGIPAQVTPAVGELIRAWRVAKGMSQADLGEGFSSSGQLVGVYERGKGASPSVFQIGRIAKALGVGFGEFWVGPPGWQPPRWWGAKRPAMAPSPATADQPVKVARFRGIPRDWSPQAPEFESMSPLPTSGYKPAAAHRIVTVDSDVMWPRFQVGDQVVVDIGRRKPIAGRVFAFKLVGGERLFLRVKRENRVLLFRPDNPLYGTMKTEGAECLGEVVGLFSTDVSLNPDKPLHEAPTYRAPELPTSPEVGSP
jgi:transcriptional regulator with XRE-family HTH domain